MKKKIILFVTAFIVLVMGIGITFYYHALPMLKLKNAMQELENETYTYSLKADVENLPGVFSEKNICFSVDGQKGESVIYGEISYEDEKFVEIYADSKKEVIFSIDPLVETLINKLEDKIGIPASMLGFLIDDLNVSLSQIEEVVGQDIVTFSEKGMTSDVLEDIAKDKESAKSYELTYLKKPQTDLLLLGEDAYYFELHIWSTDMKMILGIPKDASEKKISVYTQMDEAIWKTIGNYEICDVAEIAVPQNTVSDKTISFLKNLYDVWKETESEEQDMVQQ